MKQFVVIMGALIALMLGASARAQTCTATLTATPTKTFYGNTVSLEITVNNAPTNISLANVTRNGVAISAGPLSMPAPDGTLKSTRTIVFPSTAAEATFALLDANDEQPQVFSATFLTFTPPAQLLPANCTVTPATVTIKKLPTSVKLTIPTGTSQTFTATAVSTLSLPTTGTVTFKNRDTVLATQPLSATESDLNTRTATYTPASQLTAGTYFVTAEFDGTTNFLKSRSDEGVLSLGPDTTPDDFTFTRQDNVGLGTAITSNTVTITGINAVVTVLPSSGTLVSVNGGAFSASAQNLSNGQTLRVQHTSSCTANTEVTSTITVGTLTRTFVSRTAVAGVSSGDSDGDGIPDAVECANGTNLSVKDNDIFSLDSASLKRYVEQIYRDFLGREGDSAGITFWVGEISAGRKTRFDLLSAFFFSAEYQNVVAAVTRIFLTASNYAPSATDQADLTRFLAAYQASPNATTLQGIARELSTTRTLAGLSGQAFITKAFQNAYGRAPTATELTTYTQLIAQADGPAQVIAAIAATTNASDAAYLSPNIFVIAAYRSLLARMPDLDGFNFWVAQIRSGRNQTDLLSAFYYAAEYGSRFVASPPVACTGVVGFAAATLTASAGQTNVQITRSGGTQSGCSIEVALCNSTACGTTALLGTNYTTSGFNASSPPVATLVFSSGEVSKTLPIQTVNATSTTGATLKLSLQNPSWGGLSIGQGSVNINYPTPSSGCEWGADNSGACLPPPQVYVPGVNSNGCSSNGPGPCGSYTLSKPATCPSDVRIAWGYSMFVPALSVNADGSITSYGGDKGFFLNSNEVLLFNIKTPATGGLQGFLNAINFGQGETSKFLALSETPCDFNASKVGSFDPCYSSEAGEVGASIKYAVSSTPVAGACTLKPNTHYYLSLRAESAKSTLSTGVSRDDCSARGLSVCGHIVKFGGI